MTRAPSASDRLAAIPPTSPALQVALLLAIGAAIGFAGRGATGADPVAALAEPADVSAEDLAALVGAGEAAPAAGGEAPAEPRKVAFTDIMGTLFGQPGVVFLDARDVGSYEGGHIEGALVLDAEAVEADPAVAAPVLARIPKESVVVVYCSGGNCDLSMQLARHLLAQGYAKVLVYEGGYTEWQQEGGPSASGPMPPAEGG